MGDPDAETMVAESIDRCEAGKLAAGSSQMHVWWVSLARSAPVHFDTTSRDTSGTG
jgi:hypothetical protein